MYTISYSQTDKEKDTIFHAYKKAVLYSSIIPGGGQIYNAFKSDKKFKNAYWKVPLIYAGIGFMGYTLVFNQLFCNNLKNEYTNRQNGGLLNPNWAQYDDYSILALYDSYLNSRDLSILGLAAVYFLQIVDAGVEAHFLKFDVSPNLTLKFDATLMSYNSPGIRLNLSFH
jgi:hypothetical protein